MRSQLVIDTYIKRMVAVPTEPVTFDASHVAPDLADGIPYIIQTSTEAKQLSMVHLYY